MKSSFDVQLAKNENEFKLHKGIEKDYDDIIMEVKKYENILLDYLSAQKKILGPNISYRDIGKEIFQIEVPTNSLSKVPSNWMKKSGTKTCSRYHSPELMKFIRQYQESLELRSQILDSLYSRLLLKFRDDCWTKSIELLAELDCNLRLFYSGLANLAQCGQYLGNVKCRPTFNEGSVSFLKVKSLKHPFIITQYTYFNF
jgi:DNA mismatch repair protein MSH3